MGIEAAATKLGNINGQCIVPFSSENKHSEYQYKKADILTVMEIGGWKYLQYST